MTSDYTKVHFAFEGKKQESDLCLTLLVCKMSLDVAFAKVNIFPLYQNWQNSLTVTYY